MNRLNKTVAKFVVLLAFGWLYSTTLVGDSQSLNYSSHQSTTNVFEQFKIHQEGLLPSYDFNFSASLSGSNRLASKDNSNLFNAVLTTYNYQLRCSYSQYLDFYSTIITRNSVLELLYPFHHFL